MTSHLAELLSDACARSPGAPAIETTDGRVVSYGELHEAAERYRELLQDMGVQPGHRVGLCVRKSTAAVAAMFAILRLGAVYVPVDRRAPAARNARILDDGAATAVLSDGMFRDLLNAGLWQGVRHTCRAAEDAFSIAARSDAACRANSLTNTSAEGDVACLLYTSGSTGRPKGVMLSHTNVLSFLNWCSEVFAPTGDDRFLSYAPFHFDLSLLDLYLSVKHGACVKLIDEPLTRHPRQLASAISAGNISVWYSTPTTLRMLVEHGRLDQHEYRRLRLVLFAGEVFPLRHLRALKAIWNRPRFYNLYGPTETNVCTYYEIPRDIPDGRVETYPIGRPCSHVRVSILDDNGHEVPDGSEGELCVSGPAVMSGYWNQPDATKAAFVTDAKGNRWYRSGDVVKRDASEGFQFLGRRDRMVKRRGFRVELGEIEAALYRHPRVREVAAVAWCDAQGDMTVQVFLNCRAPVPSSLAMKEFCASLLPAYMIPDRIRFLAEVPKTSTGKTDYRALQPAAQQGS